MYLLHIFTVSFELAETLFLNKKIWFTNHNYHSLGENSFPQFLCNCGFLEQHIHVLIVLKLVHTKYGARKL